MSIYVNKLQWLAAVYAHIRMYMCKLYVATILIINISIFINISLFCDFRTDLGISMRLKYKSDFDCCKRMFVFSMGFYEAVNGKAFDYIHHFIAVFLTQNVFFLVVPCASTNIDYQCTESFQFSRQHLWQTGTSLQVYLHRYVYHTYMYIYMCYTPTYGSYIYIHINTFFS